MPLSFTEKASGLVGLGGTSQRMWDVSLSSGSTTMVFGASGIVSAGGSMGGVTYATTNLPGAAAYMDLGANLYTKGRYKVRAKSAGGLSTPNCQIALVVAQDTSFATKKKIVAVLQCISVANLAGTLEHTWTGDFEGDPDTFRYTRLENAGVAMGATPCTFDYEVAAIP